MRQEKLNAAAPIAERQPSAAFRDAAAGLMHPASATEAVTAIDSLRNFGSPAAVWECVHESLYGAGDLFLMEGKELRERLVAALARGTQSQMDELAKWVSKARLPLSYRDQIAAELVGADPAARLEWFRDLVGEHPHRRLRAVDLLCCIAPGALSNKESMTVATYLVSSCADDHGAVLQSQGPAALGAFPFSAERIAHFFSRHCSGGALAVADRAMRRNQMISPIAMRMLVEHGQQGHREAAFSFVVAHDRLLLGGFESWSEAALNAVEPKLTALLSELSAPANVLAGAVRALGRLPSKPARNELFLEVARKRSHDSEVIEAIGEGLCSRTVAPEVLAFAREVIAPPKGGFSWLKSPQALFRYSRPSTSLTELAFNVLEIADEPGRDTRYEKALSAWDVSGMWVTGPARLMLATLLAPGHPAAEAEIMRASPFDFDRVCKRYHAQLLRFAAGASPEIGQRIVHDTVRASFNRPEVVSEVFTALEAMAKSARGDEGLRRTVEFVVALGRRFPTSAVRMDLCAQFYDMLERIPKAAEETIRRRLVECSADMRATGMVVPQREHEALRRLLTRSGQEA